MADSSEIDNALVAHLGSDVTLLALVPNGVYFAEAPPNSTRYVVVNVVDERDEPIFHGTAYENTLYNVEVNMRKDAGGNPKAAFARVNVLLDHAQIAIPGYSMMTVYRESRDREVEHDEVDTAIMWDRRSGMYRLVASA